jgi:S-DNA-T family DNA segregation ATPase FtsK/SpoIIIE
LIFSPGRSARACFSRWCSSPWCSRIPAQWGRCYERLLATGRRKITRGDGEDVYLVVIDEYAYYSATVGIKKDREDFAALARDLFSYRLAFRCTTDSSSDVVLGQGWASGGYTAAAIDPLARGVAWLLSETGVPRRIKTAFLTDDQIHHLAARAAQLRRKDSAHAA